MRNVTVGLVLGLAVAASPATGAGAGSDAACFRYPERLTLSGKLSIKTYPGPPNYESVAQGDKPESVLILILPSPICLEENKAEVSGFDQALAGIREVQLAVTSRQLGVGPGQTVKVSGTAFTGHTGHHHTPIVLEEVRVEQEP